MLRKQLLCAIVPMFLLSIALRAQTPTIPTPSQTDQIITDPNANGKADPGDKIRYKVTVQNTGTGNATGVKLQANPDPRTTLDLASFRTSPLAMPDAYTCIGNVGITVPDGASDLLGNDYDDAPAGLTATAVTAAATTQGGSITIAANGSFSYNPPRGFEGTDTYQYTLNDGNAVAGVTATDLGTVTFTVSGMIWFINNNAGACASSCDGRMSNPYTSLAAFNTANALMGGLNPDNNDNIFIYESATAYTGGVVLRNGQKLFGQDATVSLASAAGLTVPTFSNALPTTNSASPLATITNAAGVGVAVAMNNTLRGFTVGNTPAANAGISGNGIGTLTISEVSVNGTGQILSLNDGVLNATFGALSTTSTTQTAIVLFNLSGSITDTDAANSSISGASGVFSITGTTSTTIGVTFNGDVTHTGGNPLVSVQNHNTGTIAFQNGTLSSTGGGINFTDSDGTYNFNGTTTLSGGPRITIDDGSSGTFNFNSNTSVTNPGNIAFEMNGSNATVDYNGTLSSNTAFRLIDIVNNTGGSASFDGNLTFTGNASGIRAQQNAGGTYSFTASSKSLSTGANTAVNLVTNPGATINFTNGGLVITTTSGTGVNATGGGTINVSGSGNNITASAGTGMNLSGITAGLTFNNVSATGGTNGIALSTVAGSLAVTTTNIQNTTGIGITNASSSATLNFGNTTVNSSAGTGVSLTNNSGAITFGDLDISPDAGQRALLATGNTNTLTATSGDITGVSNAVAVEITGVANNNRMPLSLTLNSISANGGTSGIIVANTSAAGGLVGFRVLGNGGVCTEGTPTCTGGTIQNMTSNGAQFTSVDEISVTLMRFLNVASTESGTCNFLDASGCRAAIKLTGTSAERVNTVSLTNIFVNGSGEDGITGQHVRGFILENSTLVNTGPGLSIPETENVIRLHDLSDTGAGQNRIENVIIRGNSTATAPYPTEGIHVVNAGSTSLTNLTMKDLTINNIATGIRMDVRDASNSNFVVNNLTMTGRTDVNGVDLAIGHSGDNNPVGNITVQNCLLKDSGFGFGGINLAAANSGSGFWTVRDNTLQNNGGTAIIIAAFNHTNTTQAVVVRNSIDCPGGDGTVPGNTNGANPCRVGIGISVAKEDGGANGHNNIAQVYVDGNTINRAPVGVGAIVRTGTEAAGRLDIRVKDNVFTNNTGNPAIFDEPMQFDAGSSSGPTGTLCLNIATGNSPAAGNNNSALGTFGADSYRIRERSGATFLLQGLTNGSNAAATDTFVANNNKTNGVTPAFVFVQTSTYDGGTCPTPSEPPPF